MSAYASEEITAAPFEFGPKEAKAGVILIHGFTGSPFEMRPLGRALEARHKDALTIVGPRLAGHAGHPVPLQRTTWRDWARSLEESVDALKQRCDRVAVVGLSLGGLLTLELASRRSKDLAAIASLSAPMWLSPMITRMLRAIGRTPFRKMTLPKLAESDISDPAMKALNTRAVGKAGFPFEALLSLLEIMSHVGPVLPSVTAPLLLMHARGDHTAAYGSMETIARDVGSRATPGRLKQVTLDRSFHVITLDVEREQVFELVSRHLDEFLLTPAAPALA